MDFKPPIDFLLKEGKTALSEKTGLSEPRWSNEEFLAEGGLKKLYKVYDSWNERVVVKAVPKKESDREAFISEAQRLASLQHPYILSVHDIGEKAGTPFFIMKLVEGEKLSQLLTSESLTETYAVEIFLKLCQAVFYSHESGVLHLDIKPDNIQVSEFGDLTLCDWGSSKLIGDSSNFSIASTPGYMAPEMFHGKISEQSDIFALGILLYEMLTGVNPLIKADIDKTVEANEVPEFDFSAISHKSLRAICQKALKIELRDRYKSVKEILNDLMLYKQSLPVTAEESGISRRLYLFGRRNPQSVMVTLLFVTVLALIVFVFAGNFKVQKQKASDLAEKYLNERNQRIELSEGQSNILTEQAWFMFKQFRHEEARNIVELSIQKEKTPNAALLKAVLQMVSFDKQAAILTLMNSGSKRASIYLKQAEVLIEWQELKNMPTEKWVEQILLLRNLDTYFYHHYVGYIVNNTEVSDIQKEQFINALYARLLTEYPNNFDIKILDGGREIYFDGDITSIRFYIFKSFRLRKIDFSKSIGKLGASNTKNLHYCIDLEEINFKGTGFDRYHELQELPIKKLSIENYGHVKYLQQLPVEELAISGEQIDDLTPLLKCKSLKHVSLPLRMKALPGFRELKDKFNLTVQNN